MSINYIHLFRLMVWIMLLRPFTAAAGNLRRLENTECQYKEVMYEETTPDLIMVDVSNCNMMVVS